MLGEAGLGVPSLGLVQRPLWHGAWSHREPGLPTELRGAARDPWQHGMAPLHGAVEVGSTAGQVAAAVQHLPEVAVSKGMVLGGRANTGMDWRAPSLCYCQWQRSLKLSEAAKKSHKAPSPSLVFCVFVCFRFHYFRGENWLRSL